MAHSSFFRQAKPVVGMLHLGALPGTAAHAESPAQVERRALREAKLPEVGMTFVR